MILHYHHTPIFYEIQGQGAAIVLLHGFLESTIMWKQLVPLLSKSKTVITLDLPGHGKSGCLDETHTMELMAEVVQAVLKKHHIDAATFMGHSMGGYVALAYSEMFDNEVDCLILLNSTPVEDSLERKANRERALGIFVKNPTAFIGMAISNLFAETSRERYCSEIEQLKKEALQFPKEGITAAIRGMKDRKDRISVLKKFSKPKYIICGIDDPIVPLSSSEVIANYCKVKLKKVAGGHMSLIENFEEIVKTMHFID